MSASGSGELPPGQRARGDFPRFGLPKYAHRIPADTTSRCLDLSGDVLDPTTIDDETLNEVPRVEQTSDFHCVTTWSYLGLRWGGYRFSDLFRRIIAPRAHKGKTIRLIVLKCRDGYRTALPLEDLLADDAIIADRLDNAPLTVAHGAPMRLVAPAHYAYKSAKHLKGIEAYEDERSFRKPGIAHYMDHARARVAHEERGRTAPGWLLRRVYRPLIEPTIRRFRIPDGPDSRQ